MTLIAAMGRNREIGYQGKMPWHLPKDLKHFRDLTMGHAILMGRKTWEALPGALPGRRNIVITRQHDYCIEPSTTVDVKVVHSLTAACELAGTGVLMVMGGAQLYSLCMPWANIMELTMIDAAPQADTWFPAWSPQEWVEVSTTRFSADERNRFDLRFDRWRRTPQ